MSNENDDAASTMYYVHRYIYMCTSIVGRARVPSPFVQMCTGVHMYMYETRLVSFRYVQVRGTAYSCAFIHTST